LYNNEYWSELIGTGLGTLCSRLTEMLSLGQKAEFLGTEFFQTPRVSVAEGEILEIEHVFQEG
jgi:hypothetical protein